MYSWQQAIEKESIRSPAKATGNTGLATDDKRVQVPNSSRRSELPQPKLGDMSAPNSYPRTGYANGHRRAANETTLPSRSSPLRQDHANAPAQTQAQDVNPFSDARRSLRPLAQAPAPLDTRVASSFGSEYDLINLRGAHKIAPPIDRRTRSPQISPTRPPRPHSQMSVSSIAAEFQSRPARPASTSPVKSSPPKADLSLRPRSMVLSRADSLNPGGLALTRNDSARGINATAPSSAVVPMHSALATPDLMTLGRSSTSQLRTLSKLAQGTSADEFAISGPVEEVAGLRGRRRLQRKDQENAGRLGNRPTGLGWDGGRWMDKQRQFLQAYEYLCHIGEAKDWIEDVIHKPIPPIVELEEALRDGVTLAEVVEALNPTRRFRIFRHERLQYRHSDNIAIFFRYLDEVELPDLFRFELIDLYEKKNIPKVIYCIHALSWLLYRQGVVDFRIGNLVGQLEFEHHELEAMQKGLEKLGANMPSFGNMGANFGIEPAEPPEPQESEEDRIDRELAECEASIVDLQAQIRGATIRMQLGGIMNELWDREDWIVALQAAARGMQLRREIASQAAAITDLQAIIDLQAQIRGATIRMQLGSVMNELWNCEEWISDLQAIARGMLSRRGTVVSQQHLAEQTAAITEFQAAARAALTRRQVAGELATLEQFTPQWTAIQAAVRQKIARKQVQVIDAELRRDTTQLGQLQACIRAAAVRRAVAETLDGLADHEPEIVQFQAMIRGMQERVRVGIELEDLSASGQSVVELQARMRGILSRQAHADFLAELNTHTPEIVQIQTMIRGMQERLRVALELEDLMATEEATVDLQARIRGFLSRRSRIDFLVDLNVHTAEVVLLQAFARGMMERSRVEMLLSGLDEAEPGIVELQAAARASLVRATFEEKKRFFNENMQKVVKIQSFVRAKIQGEAYKSLTTGKNPPVNAVKNFVHLLNDSDFDFHEEVEFERMRKTVVQQVRQNEMLEQYIDQLDIKIALLVKNKITLDEVVGHQSNFGGQSSNILLNSAMASTNQFDLKALNRNSRKKLELYQQLFFNLQTQPQYLARLFKRIREMAISEAECKRIEHLMMGLFGYAQKRREEYYLLKLMSRSIREEVESCRLLSDYLRGNFFWSKLYGNCTRAPRDRKYLRDFIGAVIRERIFDDPDLDLETDPLQIYKSAINKEEQRTGRPSTLRRDLPRDVVLREHEETRKTFAKNMGALTDICDQFFFVMEGLLPRMPYGLRYVCRTMYESLRAHFYKEAPKHLLQLVAHWLWRFYLQPALLVPENMGLVERPPGPLQKRNLGQIAKVLNQVSTGRPFGSESLSLQALNKFFDDWVEQLERIMGQLIAVRDPESTFDIDEFNDLYAKNKPTLYIKMADIFAIHNLVSHELAHVCPNRDDILYDIMHELGSAKNNENEMSVGSSDIQISLTPTLHGTEDPEAEVKALFMETKRCVLYIIRVQTGANLLEILVKPVGPEDEAKWRAVVREDFVGGNTKGAYSDANMVDVTAMSYSNLKRIALENVLRLEQMGRISKHNQYQDILNAIAVDIRTKSRRRVQRQRELDGVRMTLSHLHDKAKYLEQQRKSYDDYIEQAMKTLQSKKGKKRFLMPFTKQYNHQRELERSGRVPKFGSYKYSASTLSHKGVLVSWPAVPDRDLDRVNITISCDEVGVFSIEGSRGHVQIPGAVALVSIDELLQYQFESRQFMMLFDGSTPDSGQPGSSAASVMGGPAPSTSSKGAAGTGMKVNVNLLLHLLYKKFYNTK